MREEGGLLVTVSVGERNIHDPKKRVRHGLWMRVST
jgi:hypothetical protein